ncbi:MAG: hypothetical protein PHF11_05905 [Candidatus Omnitrophica bacterium]|nr:hypothetical protein [Candidatus Omnitrophota bacterium]
MKRLVICCALMVGINAIAYCAQKSRIELIDGTVIQGEIISLDKGVYTVNTGSLGAIKIDMSKIRRIETKDIASAAAKTPSQAASVSAPEANEAIRTEMDRVKSKITSDPELMKSLAGLAQDQQFQDVLKDPEISNALKSHDIRTLMKNEKFTGILNNRKLQEIQSRIKDDEGKQDSPR